MEVVALCGACRNPRRRETLVSGVARFRSHLLAAEVRALAEVVVDLGTFGAARDSPICGRHRLAHPLDYCAVVFVETGMPSSKDNWR